MDNLLKKKQESTSLAATSSAPTPSDFPIGSPESRAAARAMLLRGSEMTPYDEDCLWVYFAVRSMDVTVSPSYHDIEQTDVYKRGKEIHEQRYGPTVPYHLNAKAQRQTAASTIFEDLHGKEPRPGDILRYEDAEGLHDHQKHIATIHVMREAWECRLPGVPFPFRVENGTIHKRTSNGRGKITWVEDTRYSPGRFWEGVEADALGRVSAEPHPPHTVQAVVFVESEDGKYKTKPLEEG